MHPTTPHAPPDLEGGPPMTTLRRIVRALDAHTLWALNAPGQLGRR